MADRPLAVELHDTYCAAGDWPHAGECVAFEGYEVAANPLLTVLAGRGYARRADVAEVQAAPVVDRDALIKTIETTTRDHLWDKVPGTAADAMEYEPVAPKVADAVMALLNGGAK